MDKILLAVGDFSEVLDTMVPYYRLGEEYEVLLGAPEKRVYHFCIHDKHADRDITTESSGYNIAVHIAYRDVDPDEYLGLVISGGRAPEYLRYDADLIRITKAFFAADKPVASVCHGIEIVAAADVIKGSRVTTVAKCKYDAESAGATYLDKPVVVSGNLCTARTWHDSSPWMREYVKMLKAYKAKNA